MLELREVHHPHQKQKLFEDFDPSRDTWLVSDLKSKLEIQKRFLRQGMVLAEDSVLRVSELWRKFLVRCSPGARVISADLARSLLGQWLEESEYEWAKSPGTAQNLFAYTAQLLPILTHNQGEEILQEWWGDHSDSLVRWGHWYNLSKWAWSQFEEKNLVPSPWVSAWLSNWSGPRLTWSRRLFVDLGSELSAVEAEVLWGLSGSSDVFIVTPGEQWRGRFDKSLRGYRVLKEKLGQSIQTPKRAETPTVKGYAFHRYSTMLAEIKAAVMAVREWLKQGVAPSAIVLMAPDVETYWPVLSEYLAKEGIPAGKDHLVTLQSFPDVIRWLAHLRMDAGLGSSADIELTAFRSESERRLAFDDFRRLFSIYYDVEDLKRDDQVQRLFDIHGNPQNLMLRDEFVAWALRRWPTKEVTDQLEGIFHQFLQDCPYSTRLSLRNWVSFTEKLCARIEVKVGRGLGKGIQLLNLSSGEWVDASHIWVMGLTEDGMRRTETTGILLSDVLSLERDMGFFLNHPDRMQAEFEAEWMLDRTWSEAVLSTPTVDFAGTIQAPAMLWLRRAMDENPDWEKCTIPPKCRWDTLQSVDIREMAQVEGWTEDLHASIETELPRELGVQPIPGFGANLDLSLSVSQLESYLECPFNVAAAKIFRLSDTPELDMDVDHMSKGSLMHKLFEILTRGEVFRSAYTREELGEAVDQARTESELILADERLWPPLKSKMVDMADRFVSFETAWRANYPKTQTVGRELKVKCRWNPKEKKFVSEDQEGILFRGFVDRVDVDGDGHFVVLDYKSSPYGLTYHKSWLNNNSLQLSLYSHWLSLGFSQLGPGEVVGALYYVTKTMDRNKGFVTDEGIEGFIEISGRSQKLDTAGREALIEGVVHVVDQTMGAILAGDFKPHPKDPDTTCQGCRWRGLCRAPHLN
ncbi:MAG: PD-(D/E)XK nuclease family protein [Bdellovibrionaceae bacterium]|nr:PD-(D/E)XK nuclease family protein [Bdellovibrionales bacterium]MCB9084756.1 PD-(D/E)XK nuclease family protein [Pseudobdellovibrionaceae bacterium]